MAVKEFFYSQNTHSREYFQRNQNAMMKNITYENNIMRFAGYGWGHQRPDKEEASHIKSCGHSNKAENFNIKNNVIDTCRFNLFSIQAWSGDQYLPRVDGNTYIQYKNGKAGHWGITIINIY